MSSSWGAKALAARGRWAFAAWRSRAALHGKSLGQLWSSSLVLTGANALALALVVARASPETFAAYAAAQMVTFLAIAWTDGGVSGALQLLASREGRDRARWEAFRVAGFSLSWKIAAATAIPLGALVVALHAYGKVVSGVPIGLLVLFALNGLFQARSGLCSALVYAAGGFGDYSRVQVGAPLLRLILLGGVILVQGKRTGLPSLLSCDLASSAFGWWLAAHLLRGNRQRIESMAEEPSPDDQAIRRELARFVRPSFQANLITSLSYASGTIAGSFFASPVAVAIYALFIKVSQMTMVAVGPLAGYLARRLRLAANDVERARKNRVVVIGFIASYPAFALALMAMYLLLGRWVHHYVFAYPWEFALFLCVNGLGIFYAVLDMVLASWGQADHRPLASWIGLGKVVLLFCLRPASAVALFFIDGLNLLLIDGWFLLRLRAIHRGSMRATERGVLADSEASGVPDSRVCAVVPCAAGNEAPPGPGRSALP